MLLSSTVGSEKRAIYIQNLQHAGPFEISIHIKLAMSENDPALASACLVRYDSMKPKDRELVEFGRDEVAEAFVYTDWRDAQVALGLATYCVEVGEAAERELAGHAVSGDQQIATGLKIADLAADLGIEINPDEGIVRVNWLEPPGEVP